MSLAKHLPLSVVIVTFAIMPNRASGFQVCASPALEPCEVLPGCAGTPTEYEFGELVVLEGNVIDVSGTHCPDMLGINASVGVTTPTEDDPIFAVAWQTQPCCAESEPGGNKILVSLFGLDGTCLVSPVSVAGIFQGSCGGADRNTFHSRPSLALTRGGFAYLSWITTVDCAYLEAPLDPSRLAYGPFDSLDDVENWPSPTIPPSPMNARNEYATSSGVAIVESLPAASSSWTRVDPTEDVFGRVAHPFGVGSR